MEQYVPWALAVKACALILSRGKKSYLSSVLIKSCWIVGFVDVVEDIVGMGGEVLGL